MVVYSLGVRPASLRSRPFIRRDTCDLRRRSPFPFVGGGLAQHANTLNLEEERSSRSRRCVWVCVCVCEGNLRGGSLWILTFKADSGELVGFRSANHHLLAGCLRQSKKKKRKDVGRGKREKKVHDRAQKLPFEHPHIRIGI